VQVHNVVKLRAVEVAERVALNKVAVGEDTQLLTQQLRPLQTYAAQKLDSSLKEVTHNQLLAVSC
jgi:hypothetical protein